MAAAKARHWLAENRPVMDAWNEYVEQHGLKLAEFRQFRWSGPMSFRHPDAAGIVSRDRPSRGLRCVTLIGSRALPPRRSGADRRESLVRPGDQ